MARRGPEGPAARDVASGGDIGVFRERARRLGLLFTSGIDAPVEPPVDGDAFADATFAQTTGANGIAFIAPAEPQVALVREWIALYPLAAARLIVTTPGAIRAALAAAMDRWRAVGAIGRLESMDPMLSARRVTTREQATVWFISFAAFLVVLMLWPLPLLFAVNVFAGAFFFGVTILRFLAAGLVPASLPPARVAKTDTGGSLPIYTVLVPLRDEAHIVPQLIAALDRLLWPRDRLDVKLIVEADDLPTRKAVEKVLGGRSYEVVVVPICPPRTKPKALDFALANARGDYVTVYDAEDRPDPRQLAEAFHAFRTSDEAVACLQAPIIVSNPRAGWLAGSFAVEYSALFDGLLPALAALRLPLPLGGTSNHFRRAALEHVGAWDPFNVTEDADLGIRLARFGYRSATIRLPTYEEAPVSLGSWLKQRTRWFKGWLQTWLVHMRQPVRLFREIGLRSFVGFNLVSAGMLISALIHPVYLTTILLIATNPLGPWEHGDPVGAAVIGLNLFNLTAGYFAVVLLTARTLALRKRRGQLHVLVGLPAYWLLMSLACFRAMAQLVRRPHVWEKTHHVGERRGGAQVPGWRAR